MCHLFPNSFDLTVVKGYWLVVSELYSLFLRYTSPDFLYVRSWLPCIFFSGGVTVGNIGRQLAMVRNISSYFLLQPFFPLSYSMKSLTYSTFVRLFKYCL